MNKKRGFIGMIILIILGLAALKYFFDWSIFDAAETEEGRGTVTYIREVLNAVWRYIETPVVWIWNEVVWPIVEWVWNKLLEIIKNRGFSVDSQ
jgi:hypothetical protein